MASIRLLRTSINAFKMVFDREKDTLDNRTLISWSDALEEAVAETTDVPRPLEHAAITLASEMRSLAMARQNKEF